MSSNPTVVPFDHEAARNQAAYLHGKQPDDLFEIDVEVAEDTIARACDEIERLRAGIEKALREVGSTGDRYASNAQVILKAVLDGR